MIENFRIRVFRSVAQPSEFQPRRRRTLAHTAGGHATDQGSGRGTWYTPVRSWRGPHRIDARWCSSAPVCRKDEDSGRGRRCSSRGSLWPTGWRTLTLALPQTISQYLLPMLIAGFIKRNPKVQLKARSGNTDAMLEALVAGQIQLALIEGPEHRKDVHIEPFMEDHMVLVVPAAHEWANHEVSLEDLKKQPLLMREFGSGSRRVVEQALTAAGLKTKELTISMELDSTEGLLNAVEAGLGVTFVSRWAVRNQLALGTAKLARVQGLKLSRRFSLGVSCRTGTFRECRRIP